MSKKDRKLMKKLYLMGHQNDSHELASLMDDWHVVSRPNECDGWFEYGFFEDEPELTLDELHKLAYESFGRPYQWTYYDCTGQTFTQYISVHRNPCGYVSIVHRLAIDC